MRSPGKPEPDKVPAGCPLSLRQFQILTLQASGLTGKQIARALGVSHSVVRTHASRAHGILGISSASQAVVLMKDSGWLGSPPRRSQEDDDSRVVTPVQAAYADRFTELVRRRGSREEAMVTLAAGLHSATHNHPRGPRRRPDIEEWLLRMALKMRSPELRVSLAPIDSARQLPGAPAPGAEVS